MPSTTKAPQGMPPQRASLWSSVKLAVGTYRRHQMTDNAASLTYFAMMALFPTLVVGVSLLSLFGGADLAQRAAAYVVDNGADATTADAVRSALDSLLAKPPGAVSAALAVSLLLALNGASGGFAAAGRALNTVHGVEEDRSFVRRKLTDLAATLAVLALVLVVLVALFLGGDIARDLFGTIGLGGTAATVWSIARWPVALASALVAFGLVYAIAPDVEPRRFRWITPGAVAAVLIWILASVAFSIYVRSFSTYGAAYGVFGAAIVLLLWLYLTANAFLLGAELNMAIERQETAGRGGPPMVTPPPSPLDAAPTATAPHPARDLTG